MSVVVLREFGDFLRFASEGLRQQRQAVTDGFAIRYAGGAADLQPQTLRADRQARACKDGGHASRQPVGEQNGAAKYLRPAVILVRQELQDFRKIGRVEIGGIAGVNAERQESALCMVESDEGEL